MTPLPPASPPREIQHTLDALLADAGPDAEASLRWVATPCPPFDPIGRFTAVRAQAPSLPVTLWEEPGRGLAIVAAGVAREVLPDADAGPDAAADAWRAVVGQAVGSVVSPSEGEASALPLAPPVALGAFAFDAERPPGAPWEDLPRGTLVAPAVCWVRDGDAAWLLMQAAPASDADTRALQAELVALTSVPIPDAPATETPQAAILRSTETPDADWWMATVPSVVAGLDDELRKLVLARGLVLEADDVLDPAVALQALRAGSPETGTLFAVARDGATFLGLTPERLAAVQGRALRSAAVAGSAPRGEDAAADARLAADLQADPKERSEHAIVVEAIAEGLRDLCADLRVDAEPAVLRLPTVQHLRTPVRGTLQDDRSVLDVVARLHPTPAVGGVPRERAVARLRTIEPFDRGWYAGPVGWVDGAGDGEFVVAIRSALLRHATAMLYAGCGLVPGSDAAREDRESRLKFETMRAALGCP